MSPEGSALPTTKDYDCWHRKVGVLLLSLLLCRMLGAHSLQFLPVPQKLLPTSMTWRPRPHNDSLVGLEIITIGLFTSASVLTLHISG